MKTPPATRRPQPFTPAEDAGEREKTEPAFQPRAEVEHDTAAPQHAPFSDETAVNHSENDLEDAVLAHSEPIEAAESVLPTREPIDTVPKDGFDVHIFYGMDDDTGRIARWRPGRRFHNRRWQEGGSWTPTDNMTPLPAEEPTHWLDYHQPRPGEAQAETAAA